MNVLVRPFADLLERDGEALVLLVGGGVVRLSLVGTAIVELAVSPVTIENLASALERRFGAPPESSTLKLTRAMVNELASQGLVDPDYPPPPSEPGIHWRISDAAAYDVSEPERVVVLNLAAPAGQPRALLGSGAAIWRALMGPEDEPRPWVARTDLLADLAGAHDIEVAAIEPEVDAFLADLVERGYVDTTGGGTPARATA